MTDKVRLFPVIQEAISALNHHQAYLRRGSRLLYAVYLPASQDEFDLMAEAAKTKGWQVRSIQSPQHGEMLHITPREPITSSKKGASVTLPAVALCQPDEAGPTQRNPGLISLVALNDVQLETESSSKGFSYIYLLPQDAREQGLSLAHAA